MILLNDYNYNYTPCCEYILKLLGALTPTSAVTMLLQHNVKT